MPIDPITGSLILGAAALGGQGLNAYASGKSNAKTRKWNEKMHYVQRGEALADYQMQNEYNHPSSVMQRLKDAKLNPNLVYGNGQATTPAESIRPAGVESWNPTPPQFNLGGVARDTLSSYYDSQIKQAQVDNLRTQNTVLVQDGLLKAAQTIGTLSTAESTQFDTKLKNEIKAESVQAATLSNKKAEADIQYTLDENERRAAMQAPSLQKAAEEILNMRMSRTVSEAQKKEIAARIRNLDKDQELKQLDIDLKKNGIQPGDPLYMRALGRLLDGKTIPETFNNATRDIRTRWENYADPEGNRFKKK